MMAARWIILMLLMVALAGQAQAARVNGRDIIAAGDPISLLAQDPQHRTVTDDQIAAWNSGGGGSYTLPVASATTLGGVKVGSRLSILDEVLSANPPAWAEVTGTPTTLAGYGITDGQPFDPDLIAVAGLTTTGLIIRTGDGTALTRSLLGGTGRISIGNGNGVNGSPTIDLSASGVTAGTYRSITVDMYGRATSGANPTTLAGYSITDALPLSGGTMTAGVAFRPTGVSRYRTVKEPIGWYSGQSTSTGTLKISLPQLIGGTSQNTFISATIRLWEYNGRGSTYVYVDGYMTESGGVKTWSNHTVTIDPRTGALKPQLVRLAIENGRHVILISKSSNPTASSWSYVNAGIEQIHLSWVGADYNGIFEPAANYSIGLITDESGIDTVASYAITDQHKIVDANARRLPVRAVSGSTTAGFSDLVLLVDASGGPRDVAIPGAAISGAGAQYVIEKIDSSANTVTITPAGGETIDGETSIELLVPHESFRIISDGSSWRRL